MTIADVTGAALETAIDDDPEDAASYAVYADWLQRRGDPRGELIALAISAEAQRAANPRRKPAAQTAYDKRLAQHAGALIGRLARYGQAAAASPFQWRYGFIGRAELTPAVAGGDVPAMLDELLAHPSSRFLRELAIEWDARDAGRVLAILGARAPRSLRDLELHAYGELRDFDRIAPVLERLHRLSLTARRIEVAELAAPGLRRARFRAVSLPGTTVRAIAEAPWPQLERLEIRFGSRGDDLAVFDDLRPLLARTDLPALTHLKLRRAAFAGAILRALVGSPLAAQLAVLDLSLGSSNPADIEVLVREKAQFAHLRELWLPLYGLRDRDRQAAMSVAKHVISDARAAQDRLEDELDDKAGVW
ncbi:MAG: TIGR02996 domain-containing protein [Kofleriaceae bacterium]